MSTGGPRGHLVSTGTRPVLAPGSVNDHWLFQFVALFPLQLGGLIDEPAVYGRGPSQPEIQSIMNVGNADDPWEIIVR